MNRTTLFLIVAALWVTLILVTDAGASSVDCGTDTTVIVNYERTDTTVVYGGELNEQVCAGTYNVAISTPATLTNSLYTDRKWVAE